MVESVMKRRPPPLKTAANRQKVLEALKKLALPPMVLYAPQSHKYKSNK
jgi:hypothetical protein